MSDGLIRFLIKTRASNHYISKRKMDILNDVNGLCSCGKVGTMEHFLIYGSENIDNY
jgi:hypothetical protein